MAEQTGISWCDSTANLWIGCQKVSEACDHCYAEDLMGTGGSRLKRVEWGPGGERQFCKQGWADIKKWSRAADANRGVDPKLGRRRRIFINSLSDFFDNHPSVKWRGDAWHLIRRSPGLIFILVTKRPQLIARVLPPFWNDIAERVWLLTTAENQEWADRRAAAVLDAFIGHRRPAVIGLSCEPLLGPIDLGRFIHRVDGVAVDPLCDDCGERHEGPCAGQGLDWVIAGGESGKEARLMNPYWVRFLRDQCAAAGVAFHFKQWGEWGPVRGGDMSEGDRVCMLGEGFIRQSTTMRRVGKSVAGHLLDGKAQQEFPQRA